MSWSAVAGATSYNLRQTNIERGTVATPYSGSGTSTAITLSGPIDTDFQYAARACNSAGCSGWTNASHSTYLQGSGTPKLVPATAGSTEP